MAIKDRLIQFILRGKDEMSPEARKSAEALKKVRDESESLREELDRAKSAQGLIQSFKNTSSAADRAQIAVERAEKKAAELRAELDKAPGSKGLATSLRATEREAARAGRELDKLTVETRNTEKAARAAGLDTKKLAEEERRLAQDVDRAKAAVGSNNKELRELERKHRAASRATAEHKSRVDAARGAMASAGKVVAGYAAAYISLAAAQRAVRAGFGWVRAGISAMISSSSYSEQSLGQLKAALLASGEAAGWSGEQLLQMANDLRDASNYTTEQIVDGQTKLLSYTNIAGKEFPGAMQLTIDFAQRMGMSVVQAAERIGRSLDTPSKAMGVLGRRGFQLSESQQELVKQLEATGRVAEAQAIVMGRLTETYGGAAEAARMGKITGLWKGLQDQVGDFFELVGTSGAFDYVKGKLQEWGDAITQLKDDGRLQQLAEALSNAFVQGAEKVEGFIKSLAKVDFDTLIDDSSKWLNGFGDKIDDVTMRLQLFWAPFRTLLNGVTSGLSTISLASIKLADGFLAQIERVSKHIPAMLGGDKIRAGLADAREQYRIFGEIAVEQIEQDGADIRSAWDITSQHGVKSQQDVADAAVAAEQAKREAAEATAAKVDELNERFKQSALDAAVAGTRAITDMAEAMQLIDTAQTIEEFEGLKRALLSAYQEGRVSQEEFANSLNLTNARIKELGGEAATAAKRVDEMITSLESFADVQAAISAATTEMDVIKLGTVIKQMYTDGKITAEEYKAALEKLAKEKERVTQATEEQAKSEEKLAESVEKTTSALEKRKRITNANKDASDAAADSERKHIATVESGIGPMVMGAQRTAYYNAQAAAAAANAHHVEQARAESLIEGYERGEMSMRSFIAQAKTLQNSLEIDSSAFSTLESAIASAEQQMRSLGESSRSTLDSLRDELDKLRGNEEAIERRRMQSRQRELQAQIAEARAAGNGEAVRDLQQALGMLRTIQSETAFAREQADREKRREPTQATAPGTTAQPATPQQTAPTTVIRLESARGSGVDVSVPTGQEDALLSILEQSGLRTI